MRDEPPFGSAKTPRHPVRVIASRTGLSAHVLRAWERRYGVVTPTRSEGGQRLYSDADLERLSLLRALTAGGSPISQLARLPLGELRRLTKTGPAAVSVAGRAVADDWRIGALRAIEAMDAAGLRRGLERAAVSLGVPRLLDDVVTPILMEIGNRWQAGRMTIAQEHLAMAVARQVLAWVRETAETAGTAPVVVVATPPGQLHEGGALLAAATAASEGWRVAYLGTDLPASEIAETARRTAARAAALSIVHPNDDPAVGVHIRALRRALPRETALLVGGAAAAAYADSVAAAKGQLMKDLAGLREALRALGASA